MQIGAMVGTVMVANVFFVIIPVQKKLVDACENSTEVSLELGKTGISRSRHNNYFHLASSIYDDQWALSNDL